MMQTPRSRNAPNRSMLCSTGAVFWNPSTIAVRPDLRIASISSTLVAVATRSLFCAIDAAATCRAAPSVSLAFSQTATVVLTQPMPAVAPLLEPAPLGRRHRQRIDDRVGAAVRTRRRAGRDDRQSSSMTRSFQNTFSGSAPSGSTRGSSSSGDQQRRTGLRERVELVAASNMTPSSQPARRAAAQRPRCPYAVRRSDSCATSASKVALSVADARSMQTMTQHCRRRTRCRQSRALARCRRRARTERRELRRIRCTKRVMQRRGAG